MAIGTPTERYATSTAGMTSSPFTIHPATTVAAGTVAILVFTSGANKQVTGVTDAVGNTWVVDHVASDGTRAISICSCQVATQIVAANAVNITTSNTTSSAADVWIQEVTGLASSSAFDTSHDGTGTSTSPSSGATSSLAQADELVIGAFRNSASSTWTHGSGYSDPTTKNLGATSALEYKIVAANTAVTADGTWGTSGTWDATVATYKAATAGAVVRSSLGLLGVE